MKKGGRKEKKLIIGVIVLCVVLLAVAISLQSNDEEPLEELTSIEVKEYEGEKLDSILDFRENSIKGPQYIVEEEYKLKITGLVEEEKEYSYDELLKREHFKKVVTLFCVEGWQAKILWEGFLVKELINEAKPLEAAKVVIFHAYDGYTTSFPLEYIIENEIILADKMNDITLPPERGFPFQLVAESKFGYKWIKWITEIELSDDEDYEGYWESRGYSNDADLNEGFRE